MDTIGQRELALILLIVVLIVVVYLLIDAVEYTIERMAASLAFSADINRALASSVSTVTPAKTVDG